MTACLDSIAIEVNPARDQRFPRTAAIHYTRLKVIIAAVSLIFRGRDVRPPRLFQSDDLDVHTARARAKHLRSLSKRRRPDGAGIQAALSIFSDISLLLSAAPQARGLTERICCPAARTHWAEELLALA